MPTSVEVAWLEATVYVSAIARSLLIVDEFPAIQADADAAGLVEQLRSSGCSVALSAQSFDGLGNGKQRIISTARSLILHSCPEAEEVIKLAGTVQAYAMTTQIDSELGPTGRGSATAEQRFRVDPTSLAPSLRARHSWFVTDEPNWSVSPSEKSRPMH